MTSKRGARRSYRDRGRRAVGTRRIREEVHLCVEGSSEEQYLRALLDHRYPGHFIPKFVGLRGRKRGRKTSLINLLEMARNHEKTMGGAACRAVIWIICDVDQNEVHREALECWRREVDRHRSALQSAAFEGWLLQHFDKPRRPSTAAEAIELLSVEWPRYDKGCDIPKWLIQRTDEARRREEQLLGRRDNSGAWPVERSSQMPALIGYLDERARRRGWQACG